MMRGTRILVTGAQGSLGANFVAEAVKEGLAVRALVRNPSTSKKMPDGVDVVRGDARDAALLSRALEGCSSYFHLVNVALGPDWIETTARLLDAALEACTAKAVRFVFPANVWVFGRGKPGDRVDEKRPACPISKLGHARAQKERRIRESGARFVLLRLPEFYGPHVQTLTGPPLKRIAAGGTALWFGPSDVDVEFIYMPDAARALLAVGMADGVDGEVFHCPGFSPIQPRVFFEIAARSNRGGRFRAIPAWLVRAAGVVSPMARSFSDILHLWEAPVILDGSKLRARFPELRTTPYAEGLAATLAWHKANPEAPMYF